jgi:hypothetical protein
MSREWQSFSANRPAKLHCPQLNHNAPLQGAEGAIVRECRRLAPNIAYWYNVLA